MVSSPPPRECVWSLTSPQDRPHSTANVPPDQLQREPPDTCYALTSIVHGFLHRIQTEIDEGNTYKHAYLIEKPQWNGIEADRKQLFCQLQETQGTLHQVNNELHRVRFELGQRVDELNQCRQKLRETDTKRGGLPPQAQGQEPDRSSGP